MKKTMVFTLVFIYILTLIGCGPKPKDATTIVQEYWAAMGAHDVDKALGYLADDAIVCCDLNSGNTVQGSEKIRAMLQDVFSRFSDISYSNSNYSEKDGEVRYAYKVTVGTTVVVSGTDGLTIVRDSKIIFDGLESNKPK